MRQIEYTNVFERNYFSEKKINLNEGGAGSSKTYSICQMLLMRFINRNRYKLLVTRKTLPALRLTAYKLFTDMLIDYGYMKYCEWNKSERVITLNGKIVVFTSIDDPIKIRSTDFNDIWMEEANEFKYDDYMTLKTRLRAAVDAGSVNQMFLSYNPTDAHGYINSTVKYQNDTELIKSTYLDNPFLDSDYIAILEGLKEQDENYYRIYALGEYGTLTGIIYQPLAMKEFPDEFDEVIYGLDFGFNNPTALCRIGVKDGNYYITELLYESKLTNNDVIKRLESFGINQSDEMFADAAEPNRIEEISRAGYNIQPADKSVKDGIDYVKQNNKIIFTCGDNVNLNNEWKTYCWKKNKDGEFLDEPVKYNDHLMDAVRYALYTHSKKVMPSIRFI